MNEELRILKTQCRKAERNWKKVKLSMSLASLEDLMFTCQCAIREAGNTCFCELIAKQDHNPRILFKTVNSVIDPPPRQPAEASPEKCEEFLNYLQNSGDSAAL